MIVAAATNALPHIIHAGTNEPKFDSMEHAIGEFVESFEFHQRKGGPMSPRNRNTNNVFNTIKPPMGCQGQRNKHTQPIKVDTMVENDWQTEV